MNSEESKDPFISISEKFKALENLQNIGGEDYVVFEAPKLVEPEFRLYYDENGSIITYTCYKLEGNYIIIDRQTFIEARPDVRVIDRKLKRVNPSLVIYKLKPDTTEGIPCSRDDISIVVPHGSNNSQLWKLTTYELD